MLGCDVCQDVCPWNHKPEATPTVDFRPAENRNPFQLRELFELDDDSFRQTFRKTPLWRPKRRGILRNAAIVLGNQPDHENIAALNRGLNDSEPLVRGASAWALGRHDMKQAAELLESRLQIEIDDQVVCEINFALNKPVQQDLD